MYGMRIQGIAAYAPPDVWSNQRVADRLLLEMERANIKKITNQGSPLTDEEKRVYQTSDRWVQRYIGFSSRRFVRNGEGTIDLALRASQLLFKGLGFLATNIDRIIFGRVTPSYLYSPPDSSLLQHRLEIPACDGNKPRQISGLDTSLACSTWVASLSAAYAFIRAGMAEHVLLIGADAMSRTISWKDRAFATVLGDAGTATLCSRVPEEEDWFGPKNFWGHLDGEHANIIIAQMGGSSDPIKSQDDIDNYRNCLWMDGTAVKELIVPLVGGPAIEAALDEVGWKLSDLNLATLHEANRTQLNAKITIDMWGGRGFTGSVLDANGEFGNTTSASIPLALALNGGELKVNRKFAWVAKGGGVTVEIALGTIRHPVQTFIDIRTDEKK